MHNPKKILTKCIAYAFIESREAPLIFLRARVHPICLQTNRILKCAEERKAGTEHYFISPILINCSLFFALALSGYRYFYQKMPQLLWKDRESFPEFFRVFVSFSHSHSHLLSSSWRWWTHALRDSDSWEELLSILSESNAREQMSKFKNRLFPGDTWSPFHPRPELH